MPLVYAALESPTAVVQERSLRMIPSLSESLDYTTVKSSLFPRVQVREAIHTFSFVSCFSDRLCLLKLLFCLSK